MRLRNLAAAALVGVAAFGLSACATGLPAKVTRYSAMPIPQGQSFYVVPGTGAHAGLEFNRFASLVTQQMVARGYRPAASTAAADMLVRVSYNVDRGTQEIAVDPFAYNDPFAYRRGFYGRPYYSRYGYYGSRSPFYYGWNDPFWYRGGLNDPIRAYTVYKSQLNLDIVRRADNAPLFDGRAIARSQTDELGTLVPNLVEAMFTNFPGQNGETVRITVPTRRS